MEGESIILEAKNMYHIYESMSLEGNVVALRGLNVKINEGEAVAVIGPSGSGKSTLLKCLGGLMKPSSGSVSLGGKEMIRMTGTELVKLRQETVSFIFQDSNLLPDLNALDNVAQPLRHQGVMPGPARAKAMQLLERLAMGDRWMGMPEQLSGGEQQRVAIARALITNPKLILADEPTGALDPITSREVLELFERLHEEEDVAFLLVTHNRDVAYFCERSSGAKRGKVRGTTWYRFRFVRPLWNQRVDNRRYRNYNSTSRSPAKAWRTWKIRCSRCGKGLSKSRESGG